MEKSCAVEMSRGEFLELESDFEGIFLGGGNVVCLPGAVNVSLTSFLHEITSPVLWDLFRAVPVTQSSETPSSVPQPN